MRTWREVRNFAWHRSSSIDWHCPNVRVQFICHLSWFTREVANPWYCNIKNILYVNWYLVEMVCRCETTSFGQWPRKGHKNFRLWLLKVCYRYLSPRYCTGKQENVAMLIFIEKASMQHFYSHKIQNSGTLLDSSHAGKRCWVTMWRESQLIKSCLRCKHSAGKHISDYHFAISTKVYYEL